MKIKFEKYNPEWTNDFEKIKTELSELIGFLNPQIEHIGSTSVEGLSAKPIIDILVGLKNDDDLDKTIVPLMDNDYIYYEIYNQYLPDRRFFVKHKVSIRSATYCKSKKNPQAGIARLGSWNFLSCSGISWN